MIDRRQFFITLLTLVVTLVIAFVPYVAQKFSPDHELVFSVVGPISVKGVDAIEITLKNLGTKPAVGSKILVAYEPEFLPLSSKVTEKKDPVSRLLVDSKAPVTVTISGKYYVLDLGTLRPKEEVKVKLGSKDRALALYGSGKHMDGVEVKSDDSLGTYDEPPMWQEVFYPLGFWMFIVFLVFMMLLGIYQQFLMDPQKRDRLIQQEIDRLQASRTAATP
jgi:hypothetical protein